MGRLLQQSGRRRLLPSRTESLWASLSTASISVPFAFFPENGLSFPKKDDLKNAAVMEASTLALKTSETRIQGSVNTVSTFQKKHQKRNMLFALPSAQAESHPSCRGKPSLRDQVPMVPVYVRRSELTVSVYLRPCGIGGRVLGRSANLSIPLPVTGKVPPSILTLGPSRFDP
ncbi:hypothetical protein U0070_020920 [Myodes glareolus]|uniref:Uncharacterized protein n=1 Tax=Myodes glareolus TaxID=447135 RepID=A0AAW0IIQ5_MYOGA